MINFGALVSYLILIGDLLRTSIAERIQSDDEGWQYLFLEKPFMVAIIAVVVLFPLSITEKMASLRFVSLISLTTVVGFVGVVVIFYFVGDLDEVKKGELVLFHFDLSIFNVLSICTFAFACHTSLLPVSQG